MGKSTNYRKKMKKEIKQKKKKKNNNNKNGKFPGSGSPS